MEEARRSASAGSSKFDIITLLAKTQSGIAEIRNLIYLAQKKPYNSPIRTIIILEAQALTVEAQNALLKILEEPPTSTRFVLTSPTTENILSTISSRCEKINLHSDIIKHQDDLQPEFTTGSLLSAYRSTDKLDINRWLGTWRKKLLDLVYENEFTEKAGVNKILNYIKLINKLKSLQRRRASQKLIKSILILETPKG